MVAVIDDFFVVVTPFFGVFLDVFKQIVQVVGIILLIAYGIMLYMFNTKVNIRQYAKGGRIINQTTRAMQFKDKKTGAPKLRFFGMFGFKGEVINEPPAECLIANSSKLVNRMYDFVKKDGIYHPVQNFVLGIPYEEEVEIKKKVYNPDTKKKEEKIVKEVRTFYSIKGSGIELNRDFDSVQSIQNKLIEEAIQYRNKKPTEVIASFALMIITVIVSGVVMWFAWTQFGNMAGAIAGLREPLKEGITGAAQSLIGPG